MLALLTCRRALHASHPLAAAAVGTSRGGRADAGPSGQLPHARGLDDDHRLHPVPPEAHNPAHDSVLGTILAAATDGGVPPHAAGGEPGGARGGGASKHGESDDDDASMLHKAKGKLKKAVGSVTEKVAHAFTSHGAVGREFESEGAVGETIDKAAGGPLSSEGTIGRVFTSHGAVGGTVDAAAKEVEEEGEWVKQQGVQEEKKKG